MPAQSTAHLMAYQVMIEAAAFLNDPAMTDYTYAVQLPFLNMAIEELNEHLEEANVALTNSTSVAIIMPGVTEIVNSPTGLVEIQMISEREKGSNSTFKSLPRREFIVELPASSSLLYWVWQDQRIRFNPRGCTSPMEVQIDYISRPIRSAQDPSAVIGTINASSFLVYKTAAMCAMFIGENETRSGVLNEQAELALERIIGVTNKGKQQIMTRHRPFRAGYKARGY